MTTLDIDETIDNVTESAHEKVDELGVDAKEWAEDAKEELEEAKNVPEGEDE